MTRERVYNYPTQSSAATGCNLRTSANSSALSDVPKYTTMTECWIGMDVPPAVTTYAVNSNASPQTVDTWYPDGTRVTQLMGPAPSCSDALLCSQQTYDRSGNLLQRIDNTWQVEDYDSPSLKSVTVTDQLGQTTTTTYDYYWDLYGIHSTNQIVDTKQFDYLGTTTPPKILRLTHVNYLTDTNYTDPNKRHIFNLPTSISIEGEKGSGEIFAKTEYVYDQQPLVNTPGVVGYTDPGPYRGNVAEVKRYTGTAENSPFIAEFRRYDMTGNLVEDWGPCCVDTKFTYTPATQFAYPEQITRGDTGSTAHVSQSFAYDPSTGLLLSSTDANGLVSRMSYDNASLRLLGQTLPAPAMTFFPSSGYVQYAYDDSTISVTQSSYIPNQAWCLPNPCQPTLEAQSITQFNGLGLVQRVQNKGDGDS